MDQIISKLGRTMLGFSLLVAAPTWAYTPCAPGPQSSIPVDGSVDVPTNAQLAVWYASGNPEESPIRLIETDTGEEVSVSLQSVNDAGGLYLFHPDSLLKANTEYTIEWSYRPDEFRRFTSFLTASYPDNAAPEPSAVTCVERGTTENEGGVFEWVLGHLSAAEQGVYHRVEWSQDVDFTKVVVATIHTNNERALWSTESCLGVPTHPREVKYMRVVAIDSAGNESTVSNEMKVEDCKITDEASAHDACGRNCSVLTASHLGWISVCLLPVITSRRRRCFTREVL